jgi:hypothetical protein
MRRDNHMRAHEMLCTWASHKLLLSGTSQGQGYQIGDLKDYSGLPAHSLIPLGVEFTTPEDIAISNFIDQTTDKYREYIEIKYLNALPLSKYKHNNLLDAVVRYLFT